MIISEDAAADYVAKTFVVERVYRYDEKTDSLAEISNEIQEIVPLKNSHYNRSCRMLFVPERHLLKTFSNLI